MEVVIKILVIVINVNVAAGGINVTKTCSINCQDGCDKGTGHCDCYPGYWGDSCELNCPSNCVNDECDKNS